MSGASAILARLDSPEGKAAWTELLSLLDELASKWLTEPCTGKRYQIPEVHRQDVVQAVALKIFEKGRLPVVGKSDAECRSYLCTMLVRRWLTCLREMRAEILVDPNLQDSVQANDRPTAPSEDIGVEAFVALDRLCDEYCDARPQRYQGGGRRTWKEIENLISSSITLEAILEHDYGVVRSQQPEEFVRQRDSVLQAHSRLRRGLSDLIQEKRKTGQLTEENAQVLEIALERLRRCQRASQTPVSSSE